MAWTDERIAQLKEGWEGGMTASQIADQLGEGVSRNAVIGKAHRLGLKPRPSPVRSDDPAVPEATSSPTPSPAAPAPAPTPAPPPVQVRPAGKKLARTKQEKTSLLDLNEKVCKWPIGHPGEADFHFCGKPSQAGFPYCTDHCLVAYQAQLPRRDRDRRPPPQMPGMPRR